MSTGTKSMILAKKYTLKSHYIGLHHIVPVPMDYFLEIFYNIYTNRLSVGWCLRQSLFVYRRDTADCRESKRLVSIRLRNSGYQMQIYNRILSKTETRRKMNSKIGIQINIKIELKMFNHM